MDLSSARAYAEYIDDEGEQSQAGKRLDYIEGIVATDVQLPRLELAERTALDALRGLFGADDFAVDDGRYTAAGPCEPMIRQVLSPTLFRELDAVRSIRMFRVEHRALRVRAVPREMTCELDRFRRWALRVATRMVEAQGRMWADEVRLERHAPGAEGCPPLSGEIDSVPVKVGLEQVEGSGRSPSMPRCRGPADCGPLTSTSPEAGAGGSFRWDIQCWTGRSAWGWRTVRRPRPCGPTSTCWPVRSTCCPACSLSASGRSIRIASAA